MGSRSTEYIDALLKYLQHEANNKNKPEIITAEWELVTCDIATTPQQNNSNDCGVFILMFADFLRYLAVLSLSCPCFHIKSL
jgi:Ulp1 family protease